MFRARRFGFASIVLSITPLAVAGEQDRVVRVAAPLEIPHATNLDLDFRARKRAGRPDNIERSQLLEPTRGLEPLVWPHNSDMRARLVTPALARTPVVGWIATNLYRSRKDAGWCLEVDPGQGEYLVSYRLNLK